MGTPGKVRQGKHAGVRIWRIRDFEEYLVAYGPHAGGVAVNVLSMQNRTFNESLGS
jgi:hypothetical protein